MNKLKYLREFMNDQKLDAFLIPRTDEFQGEYIAAYSERLAWLTGFKGSSGFAIITIDQTIFFTDGRYILQAKNELPSIYQIYNNSKKSPSQWVNENLSSQARIGYDPWLFTECQLKGYNPLLIPLTPNPIDLLWQDRPAPPQDPLSSHALIYAGESDESKRLRIAKTLKAKQVLLTTSDSIAWLLNIRGRDVPHTPIVHSMCVLKQDGTYDFFVNLAKVSKDMHAILKKKDCQLLDISTLLPYLKNMEGSCQLDPQAAPVIFLHTLERAGTEIVREKDPCLLPKAIKNAVELEGAKKAHIQDGMALAHFFDWLNDQPLEGETTELSASEKLYMFRKERDLFQDVSFETISGFGPHGAIIHYASNLKSNIPLTKNGLYLLDSGGQYLNGTTDVTRTLALGDPTDEQKDRYTRVLKGHIALAKAIFPDGTTGAQLDILARQYLWQIGCDYDHGTGHGVGSYLSVHEGPQSISKRSTEVALKPGMILSNEPGYYKEGDYGIRIESLMAVIEIPNLSGFYGFEMLTLALLDMKLIEKRMLTDQELLWIQKYHESVKQIINS